MASNLDTAGFNFQLGYNSLSFFPAFFRIFKIDVGQALSIHSDCQIVID